MKYRYKDINGLIDVNTLSPCGKFYYKLQAPVALNPSAFGCKVAFFTIHDELLYHRRKMFAHELHDKSELERERQKMNSYNFSEQGDNKTIEIVRWSKGGNMVYFLEHLSWNQNKVFNSVFINLKDKFCYRINELDNDFEIVTQLEIKNEFYDENEIEGKLNAYGFIKEKLIKDSIGNGLFGGMFWRNKWYP